MALALAACAPTPDPAHPALWRVDGPQGQRGWLFGTIHALPRPVLWRSATVDAALASSDRLVLEVARIDDDKAIARKFAELSHTPGQPSLDARIAPALRPALDRLLAEERLDPAQFGDTETWAAALALAQHLERRVGNDSGNGIDRALLRAVPGKPVAEFEGADAQFATFDRLPEAAQRELLAAIVSGANTAQDDTLRLAKAWRSGDMAAIEADTRAGLLAWPDLREALFVARNRAWVGQLAAMLDHRQHPFVAVGAAHMAGPAGLPAMLTQRGYRVTRLQ